MSAWTDPRSTGAIQFDLQAMRIAALRNEVDALAASAQPAEEAQQ